MDPDDLAYRKSVRNMALVLAAIVITIFAAIFIPPYVNPPSTVFPQSVSFDSAFGFTMYLTLNSTSVQPLGHLLLTGWLNSTSDSIQNLTLADSWSFPEGSLWGNQCTSGWPIGLGIISGQYGQDNYSLGTLLTPAPSRAQCAVSGSPQYFLLYPHSDEALASVNGNPIRWTLMMNLTFGEYSLNTGALPGVPGPKGLPPGIYTAVLADEWGDVLTANFRVA